MLIIAIFVLLIGIVIKRFGMGAKGWEQIPFIGIWRFVGNFLAVSALCCLCDICIICVCV